MSPIAAAVTAFFEQRDWATEPVDDRDIAGIEADSEQVLVASISGVSGSWPLLVAVIGDGPSHLVVQSIAPAVAPVGDEVATLELLARLNDGLLAGCFELDLDNGTVRLRTAIPVGSLGGVDHDVLVAFVDDLVTANVTTADRCWPALDAVVDHGVAPAIAVASITAGLDPTPR